MFDNENEESTYKNLFYDKYSLRLIEDNDVIENILEDNLIDNNKSDKRLREPLYEIESNQEVYIYSYSKIKEFLSKEISESFQNIILYSGYSIIAMIASLLFFTVVKLQIDGTELIKYPLLLIIFPLMLKGLIEFKKYKKLKHVEAYINESSKNYVDYKKTVEYLDITKSQIDETLNDTKKINYVL